MPLNQEKFLGHSNYNGMTVSMRDVQTAQMNFWTDVYTAAVRAGRDSYGATIMADAAMEKFNERFIRPPIPEEWKEY